MNWNHLRAVLALSLVALCATPALEAKNRKAEKFFKDGQTAENKNDWDDALRLYQLAVDQSPKDPQYLIAMRRARFQAGQMHVENGLKLRGQGKLAEAMQQFQTAIIDDPSSAIALQEIKRTQQMIEQQQKGEVKADEAGLTPAERIRREDDERVESMQGPPQLKPVIRQIPTLKMNNQPPRILYETVGKLAGINVVFDSQYQAPSRGFTVEMDSSQTVEQAFDYLAVLTHTYWKPISANTIFVTEDNATKRRDYEDQVVKVFYVTNATSVQEFQEIATAIRTVADIRRVYTYNAQKAMVVRGTVDQVALAEKLVRDLDKPKSEVVCELIFMQVNSARTRDLAATIVNASGTAGLNVPFAFTPRSSITINSTNSSSPSSSNPSTTSTTTTAATSGPVAVSLNNLQHLSSADFSTSLPGALLEAMMSDNNTKVLSRPELRVSDGMKGELQIGDRIPYATGSFGSTIGAVGTGLSPLVSTQFNFADTGTTMIIQPQVHSSNEVTLHIEITVAAVKEYLTIGGTGGLSQPVITQNKSITDLRLRDGEINILGGLDQIQDSLSVNGIPGLVNVPALGSVLFGSRHTEKDNSQLLIALIPHIVRTPDYTVENLKGIFAGWEQTPKVIYAPRADESAAPPANPGANAAPAAAPPKATAPTPGAPAPGPPANPPPPPPAGQARLSLLPTPVQAAPNAEFTVTVRLDNAADLFSVSPLRIKFDPAQVRLNDVTAGDMVGAVTLEKDIRNDSGDATVTITRPTGSGGVNGSGVLATLRFMAVAPGSGSISITEATVRNSQSQVTPAGVGSVPVTIR